MSAGQAVLPAVAYKYINKYYIKNQLQIKTF